MVKGPEDTLTTCLLQLVPLPRCPLHLGGTLACGSRRPTQPRTLVDSSAYSLSCTLVTRKACCLPCPILTLCLGARRLNIQYAVMGKACEG